MSLSGYRMKIRLAFLLGLTSITANGQEAQEKPAPAEARPVRPALRLDAAGRRGFGGVIVTRSLEDREHLNLLLGLKIAEVDRSCTLTELQKKKLALAGRGDITRFLDELETVRQAIRSNLGDVEQRSRDAEKLQVLRSRSRTGLFEGGSVFAKTLNGGVLREDQAKAYAKALREKRQFHFKARAEEVIWRMDDALGLTDAQCRQFLALLLTETEPPARFGPDDVQVLLCLAAGLPESKLKPIFDDAQWRIVQERLARAKRREPEFRRAGLLPEIAEPARIAPEGASRPLPEGRGESGPRSSDEGRG